MHSRSVDSSESLGWARRLFGVLRQVQSWSLRGSEPSLVVPREPTRRARQAVAGRCPLGPPRGRVVRVPLVLAVGVEVDHPAKVADGRASRPISPSITREAPPPAVLSPGPGIRLPARTSPAGLRSPRRCGFRRRSPLLCQPSILERWRCRPSIHWCCPGHCSARTPWGHRSSTWIPGSGSTRQSGTPIRSPSLPVLCRLPRWRLRSMSCGRREMVGSSDAQVQDAPLTRRDQGRCSTRGAHIATSGHR